MARRKEAKFTTLYFQDGFAGTSAINEATPAALDTTMGVDTHVLSDSVTIVPKGARFVTAGIATVRTVTATQNSMVFTLTIDATGGTFDLVLNGETAATIAYDATSATIQTALEGLASVTAGDVTVTGDGPHVVTMAGDLANDSTVTFTSVATSLTGGASTAVIVTDQDGTTTWEVTFSPAIATGSVPSDDDVITWYPQRVEIVPNGDGDLAWTESNAPEVTFSRGVIDGALAGPEVPMTIDTLSFILDWLRASSGGAITPYEALNQLGDASTWLTSAGLATGGSFCEPYSVDIVAIDAPECGSEEAEVMIFRRFMVENVNPALSTGQVDIDGVCAAAKVEATRVTNNADAIGIIR